MTPRRLIAAALTTSVVVAACGSDSDVADTLPDADELIERADELGVSPLSLALDQTVEASAYRASLAIGLDMDLAGERMSVEADLDNAYARIEADADGEEYSVVDMGALLESMAGAGGEDLSMITSMFGDDLEMETWTSGSTLFLDLGGFSDIMAMSGMTFPADRFSVDLEQLGPAIGGTDVASTLSGQAAPDPVELATVLRDVLDADGDGTAYRGTIGFLDFSRAFGQDPGDMAGAGGLGGVDPATAETMMEIFEEIQVDVEVTLDGAAVDIVRFDVDMSAMLGGLGELAGEPGADELDGTFGMTMLFDYDVDPTVDVQLPSVDDYPDATADFLELFGTLGA